MDEEIGKVLPKIGKDQSMTCAADVMDEARGKVAALVARQERSTGSWMRAYEDVGGMIGRSESWIRKLLNRTLDNKRPDAVALLNIRAVYDRLCACQMQRLRDEIDETEKVTGPDNHMVRAARSLVGEDEGQG